MPPCTACKAPVSGSPRAPAAPCRSPASSARSTTIGAARAALIASVAGAGDTTPAFDLVLSDANLGDGHVSRLVSFMRESVRPGVTMPPLVCMSAGFDAREIDALAGSGAIDLLTKDSDVAAFATRVAHSFATRALA